MMHGQKKHQTRWSIHSTVVYCSHLVVLL